MDDVVLEIPANRYLMVDDRMLPRDLQSVNGTEFDWRTAHRIEDAVLDTAFTDLSRGADGHWEVGVQLADNCTYVWGDEHLRWVQIFTGGPYRNTSVAVEPMTCGPDALTLAPPTTTFWCCNLTRPSPSPGVSATDDHSETPTATAQHVTKSQHEVPTLSGEVV